MATVSVWGDETDVEIDGGAGCTTIRIYFMPLNFLSEKVGVSLRHFTPEMGAIQHEIQWVVSGPSKDTKDVEWLCKH